MPQTTTRNLETKSLGGFLWEIAKPDSSKQLIDQILENRNLSSEADAALFKAPKYEIHQHDPLLLKDMEKAVDIAAAAIAAGKNILVFGDYDADGVTSTALLYSFLKQIGANCAYHIPHRINDGYGITVAGVRYAKENGAELVITVDNGIAANDAIDEANALGLDVIITDHHKQNGELPKAAAVVNPNQTDCLYPFKGISGVGVAFKFISVLADKVMKEHEKEHFLRWNLDLVAMGTVADVMPLIDENRVFVKYGLKVIAKTKRLGIRALLHSINGDKNASDPTTIAFQLGPRINAAGRLEAADKALELLLSNDMQDADRLSAELNAINKQRQQITERSVKEAEARLNGNERVIILDSEDWHQGIIGLIAARLCEAHYKPVLIFNYSKETNTYKASGRSPAFVDITKMIMSSENLLIAGGGHRQACGCSIKAENFAAFKEAMTAYMDSHIEDAGEEILSIEGELREDRLSIQTIEHLDRLQPYGNGFPEPIFFTESMTIKFLKRVGFEGKHLSIELEKNKVSIRGIAFKLGHLVEQLNRGQLVDVAYVLQKNEWNGRINPQLMIKDIRS
jgi:single-stranded-DNA-specific exonuclease